MVKKGGVWYVTSEGQAVVELDKIGLSDAFIEGYKKWKVENQQQVDEEIDIEDEGKQGFTLDGAVFSGWLCLLRIQSRM